MAAPTSLGGRPQDTQATTTQTPSQSQPQPSQLQPQSSHSQPTQQPPQPTHLTPLPAAFTHTTPPPTPIYQGAEAVIYLTHFLTPTSSLPSALKHRPPKPYRHPTLDARLTRHRILAEARALVKLRREGLRNVPAVYALDWEQGWMVSEFIQGRTVRGVLDEGLEGWLAGGEKEGGLWGLMGRVGGVVGGVHKRGVVHGDLTTSNLMVRGPGVEGEVVVIDFGLAGNSVQDEDRAVDLYVLERAFGSSHPRAEELWGEVLRAYGDSFKGAKVVVRRLEEVRMRGRKKIMIG